VLSAFSCASVRLGSERNEKSMEEREMKIEGGSEVRPAGSSRRLCLCGNSLILATLRECLRRSNRLEVVSLSSPSPQARELEALAPDVILFDSEAGPPSAAFTLLARFPSVVVVGVSPDSNTVKLWSGRQLSELSMEGLLETIDPQLSNFTYVVGEVGQQGATTCGK